MANGITEEPPMMTPSEIRGSVQERIGGGRTGQDFESWRYNIPQGEFGTAYPKSRRKMRMEEEYRKYELENFQQQKAMQEMEAQAKQMESLDLDVRLKERQLSVNREADIFNKSQQERTLAEQEQAFKYINAVRGQPNAYEAAAEAISELPFAAASEPVQKALWALGQARQVENTAQIAKEQKLEQRRLMEIESEARQSGATTKEIESTRRIDPDGNVYVDEEALRIVRDNAKLREKKEGAREPARTRAEALEFDIVGLDAKITEMEENDPDDEEVKKLKAERAAKQAQLRKEQGEEPKEKEELQKFDSVEDAVAAGLPSGTVVDIGGRKARID
jgi:hypothetical protein